MAHNKINGNILNYTDFMCVARCTFIPKKKNKFTQTMCCDMNVHESYIVPETTASAQ